MVEDGDDEDVEHRVPPANDNTGTVRLGHIRRPEDSHETIMLYHDSLPRNAYGRDSVGLGWQASFRKSLVVGAARGQRHQFRGLGGAVHTSIGTFHL